MRATLALIFFLSGASALIFEALWFRLAGLSLGNSVWSASLVLAAFMGGLALGNALVARYHDRLIIIDSPPPRLAAESSALARQVDGILLVVKYASTPRDMITELIDKLGADKVLGAIVNNFEMSSPFYAKRYYGYYGERYRQK